MFLEKLENLREKGGEILLCLNGDEKAKAQWLEAGGEERHILTPRQVESWLMLGGVELPKEIAFSGSLSEFISQFPKTEIERSKVLLNRFLQGAVAEYEKDEWAFFTCNAVVMGCCMGEYFSVANRKEL